MFKVFNRPQARLLISCCVGAGFLLPQYRSTPSFPYSLRMSRSQCEGPSNAFDLSPAGKSSTNTSKETRTLFPPLQAYRSGRLQVSGIHNLAFWEYGNPAGVPVLFVHGGPGGGTDPAMARFFDPQAYRIILVDQRGCGQSTPHACLEENDTWALVGDFEKLRLHLGIDKWLLFGGSWGSTLALAYAQTHPCAVRALVLRGVFLLRKKELDWLYQGPGAGLVFPEDWRVYEQFIPADERGDLLAAYGRRLRGELGEKEMLAAAKVWSVWEGRVSKLIQDPAEATDAKFAEPAFALAFARIENHYFAHGGFLAEGELLSPVRLARLTNVPTVIVQGRYDMVCPAVSAYDLHQALPHAQIVYTLSGHSGFEPEIVSELVKATEKFKYL